MKSALKALSLSLLVFVPILAHENCSKTTTQTTTIEDKHVQTTAAVTEEATEATRKPTPVAEEVTVAQAQEVVAPKAETTQTA